MTPEQQFEEIYNENYHAVISLCLGYVNGNKNLAQDLTQEVFIKVWQNLKSFRNEASISTWIYRITVNTCFQQLRKKQFPPITIEEIPDETEEEKVKTEMRYQSMYHCIDLLSDTNKNIVLLELQDVPQKEISNITGISYEALRIRLHRIKNQLAKCIKK
ncbi:sigma-70 family RNA polymerase sigma factor [Chryseobacterium sp. Tr-659]|uniref:RNA polymerase sigma factor n=1 Tax=Chryseobacterium sp. Tr-659 TaxID=2608340 RepID=UPI0014246554|nr:sigma-70 family RNA polymerase sigma factor [Chryseobacterium sp. Tr-659]NIF04871.1 sigma-70 family RNA polymerase sigma factor [Chryseobacterium sp. Tr-659]